jgi:SIR2-like domain
VAYPEYIRTFALSRFLNGLNQDYTVWHLHGEISNPHELILSPDGYEQLYHSDKLEDTAKKYTAALAALKAILVTRRLLFIGFSFADTEFVKQLEWLRNTFEGQAGPHFALVPAGRLASISHALKEVDVECVSYIDHGAPLLALLDHLAEIVNEDLRPPPLPTADNLPLCTKGVVIEDHDSFPGCAEMSIDSGNQGSSIEAFDLLLDLRFGRGQLKRAGMTVEYALAEAELLIDRTHCDFESSARFGDAPRNPNFVAEPDKWRITGPLDYRGTLAGSAISNEVLCRLCSRPGGPKPSVTLSLVSHRSYIRYNVLADDTDDAITLSANKAAIIAAFLNKCQMGEGGWVAVSKSQLVWNEI